MIEIARDQQLYTAITDCCVGGFSSAVGEMGKELGVEVELTNAPTPNTPVLALGNLDSQAQERIVIAVPPAKLAALQLVCDLWTRPNFRRRAPSLAMAICGCATREDC